ncbi:protein of unknown function [Methylocella tundrae]|uniref:Uncharacterized protein n=1 Tax=Methylocella tundrae TaxID=227605 RepID=A0A4U8Z7A2_METTU|nr:protein of unknown function [Methylocella tundrae]
MIRLASIHSRHRLSRARPKYASNARDLPGSVAAALPRLPREKVSGAILRQPGEEARGSILQDGASGETALRGEALMLEHCRLLIFLFSRLLF